MTNILLVEDDPGIVANLTEFLKREGFSITAVNGQTKAMELLMEENVPFDLLLLDVSLSDGNGFSICAAVKACSSGITAATLPRQTFATQSLTRQKYFKKFKKTLDFSSIE